MQSVVILSDAAVLKTNLLNMFLSYVLLPRISSEYDFMLEKHKFLLFQFSGILCSFFANFQHIAYSCHLQTSPQSICRRETECLYKIEEVKCTENEENTYIQYCD